MKVNLQETKNYLINLDDALGRLTQSSDLLEDNHLPFERFPGIKNEVGVVGCAMSHQSLLKTASSPCLILEDDIGMEDSFRLQLDIPDEADAVYLGVSNHGYVRGYDSVGIKNIVMASQYDDQYKRVYNMCSTHAILYLTDSYISAALEKIEECLEFEMSFDLGLASIHKDFVILTPNKPFFYQTEQEDFTRLVLSV